MQQSAVLSSHQVGDSSRRSLASIIHLDTWLINSRIIIVDYIALVSDFSVPTSLWAGWTANKSNQKAVVATAIGEMAGLFNPDGARESLVRVDQFIKLNSLALSPGSLALVQKMEKDYTDFSSFCRNLGNYISRQDKKLRKPLCNYLTSWVAGPIKQEIASYDLMKSASGLKWSAGDLYFDDNDVKKQWAIRYEQVVTLSRLMIDYCSPMDDLVRSIPPKRSVGLQS